VVRSDRQEPAASLGNWGLCLLLADGTGAWAVGLSGALPGPEGKWIVGGRLYEFGTMPCRRSGRRLVVQLVFASGWAAFGPWSAASRPALVVPQARVSDLLDSLRRGNGSQFSAASAFVLPAATLGVYAQRHLRHALRPHLRRALAFPIYVRSGRRRASVKTRVVAAPRPAQFALFRRGSAITGITVASPGFGGGAVD